jgi:hypothetical protein
MDAKKINSLREMAKRGTENEREIAKKILMREGIDIDSEPIESDKKESYCFRYNSAMERRIIFQTYFTLFPESKTVSYTPGKKKIWIRIDPKYKKLMYEKTAILIDDYRKQLKLFNEAFMIKNDLLLEPEEDEDETVDLSEDYNDRDRQSIIDLMRGLNKTIVKRALKDVFR